MNYGLWQFGGESNYIRSNKVAGVVTDQNYAFKDYPAIMKKHGLNGFTKEEVKKEEPQAKPVEKPVVKEEPRYYIVKWGDTLTKIAKTYKTTVNALVKLNNIKDADKIYAGQKIRVK